MQMCIVCKIEYMYLCYVSLNKTEGGPIPMDGEMAHVVQTEHGPVLMGPDGPVKALPPGVPIMIPPGMEPQLLGPVGPDGMQQVLVHLDQPQMVLQDQVMMERGPDHRPDDDKGPHNDGFRSRGRGRGRGRWIDRGRGRGRWFDRGRGRGFDRGRGRGQDRFKPERREDMLEMNRGMLN